MAVKKGYGTSHSKIILIGEHSIVYGYPAIAVPLKNIEVKCEVEKNKDRNFQYDFNDVLSTAVYSALEYLGKEGEKLKYKIDSSVPQKRGMGSSAAVSIAGIKAVFDYFSKELPEVILEQLVNKAEIVAHRTPSGLDAKTCLSDKAIKFTRYKGFENIELNTGSYLIIADTGIHGHTKDAIENVKKLGNKASDSLKMLGRLAEDMEKSIREKNIVDMGKNMTLAHIELKKMNVSIEKSDNLIKEAIKSGALGAKMTGGGLGGCIIALTDSKEKSVKIAEKLIKEGAVNIWMETL